MAKCLKWAYFALATSLHVLANVSIFNDQIKKFKCPGNVFRVHIYINTALDMFKKDDVESHSFPKNDLHFGGYVPVMFINIFLLSRGY